MLLLTSVILLIGFIALSSMVIRVTQLPEETTQDSRRPIDLEADAVAEGVRHLLLRTHERVPVSDDPLVGHADYNDAVEGSLRTVTDLERGRGFRFSWIPDPDNPFPGDAVRCTEAGLLVPEATLAVTVTLQDLDTRIQVTVKVVLGTASEPVSCKTAP